MSSLLQSLKERKLVQWAIAYLAGAWVIFEATGTALEAWNLSPLLVRSIHLLLVVGFFVTLVLAWYHGEKGRQKVSGPELLMVASLLVVAGVALSFLGPPSPRTETTVAVDQDPGEGSPRVAVLPCINASPDPEDAFRADGLHDEILLKLQKISSLVSIGRTSVLQFGADRTPPSIVAGSLGVQYVGECTVQRSGSRFRVIFQLLDAAGVQVWAEEYDRELTIDILDIQIDIAQQVAQAVGVTLTPAESLRVESRPTAILTAYDLYQLGRGRWMKREGAAYGEAIDFFEAAITEDPSFALAHAGLAQTYMLIPIHGDEPVDLHEEYAKAKEAVGQAMILDPDLAEAHSALGFISYAYDWDWAAAEQHLLRAVELDPGDAETHAWYSDLLQILHRDEEARAQARYALDLDPLSWNATRAFMRTAGEEDTDEAAAVITRFLQTNPDHLSAHGYLFALYFSQGRMAEAGEELILTLASFGFHEPDSVRVLFQNAPEALDPDRTLAILKYMEQEAPRTRVLLPFFFLQLGQFGEALEGAKVWVDSRSYAALQIADRAWEPVYTDPRYLALLDEVGLPHPGGGV